MRINFNVPTKWDALTPWQLARIGGILSKNEEIETKTFRRLFAIILLIPKPGLINILKLLVLLFRHPLSQLEYLSDFIFDEAQLMTVFQKLFRVKGAGGSVDLYGPAPRLTNVSILELSYADTFYYNWRKTGDDIHLRRLCAVLYRPEGHNNTPETDKRAAFNALTLPDNAVLTDQIRLCYMYMVGLAYQGSREVLQSRYKKVFPAKKKKDDDTTPEQKKKSPKYQPFSNLITSMALDEVNPFGTLEGAEQANAHKFLEVYNEQLIRMEKREAELQKLKTKNRG